MVVLKAEPGRIKWTLKVSPQGMHVKGQGGEH